MAVDGGHGVLDPGSNTLTPLPTDFRQGLAAIAALGWMSWWMSMCAFSYLVFKLVRWRLRRNGKTSPSTHINEADPNTPFEGHPSHIEDTPAPPPHRAHLNQFLILILNLFLADIHLSAAFAFDGKWVVGNIVDVSDPACFAQGWLGSTGYIASSLFIAAIALYNYLAIVWSYKPPQRALYLAITSIWAFDYLLAILGPATTANGREFGGFYVRAGPWCWINTSYPTIRFFLHYLWIFLCLLSTLLLYTLIFLSTRKTSLSLPSASPSASPTHQNIFLLYPTIYILTSLPLVFLRLLTMTGVTVSTSAYCAAGGLLACNGLLDVVVWGVTKKRLLFSWEVDVEEVGLESFEFMRFIRTPKGRMYGNMVWVQGGVQGGEEDGGGKVGKRDRGIRMETTMSVDVECNEGVEEGEGQGVGGDRRSSGGISKRSTGPVSNDRGWYQQAFLL